VRGSERKRERERKREKEKERERKRENLDVREGSWGEDTPQPPAVHSPHYLPHIQSYHQCPTQQPQAR
jgi:hypothetical protein